VTETTETPETPKAIAEVFTSNQVRHPISNAEFMSLVFKTLEGDERPITISIFGAINSNTIWGRGQAWTADLCLDDTDANQYFTLATYSPTSEGYRRTKRQFNRAFGIMLDDIGTKAGSLQRLESCPPSYLIETSPGNFQAGYLFDSPCSDIKRLEALNKALINAGLSDPGATGPTSRLGRLPNGINGKYDPPVRVSLVVWHPDRRYSIQAILEGFGLDHKVTSKNSKSKASNTNGSLPVYEPSPTYNQVLERLKIKGLYKALIDDGKHDITCPWVHEHTNQIDHGTAYFEPSQAYPAGGFKCLHGHCADRHLKDLLIALEKSIGSTRQKSVIRVVAGSLFEVVNAAERELALHLSFFQRGGVIVKVSRDPGTHEASVKALSEGALCLALSEFITWERFDQRSNNYVSIDPPTRHLSVLLNKDDYHHLAPLKGLIRQPLLLPDGHVVNRSGFDPYTGTFGVFNNKDFSLADSPTRVGAADALAKLDELLTEFSFATPKDHAAALGAILTAAVRPSLSLAPMFHIKAPMIGSGKSYLGTLIATFAGPSIPPAIAMPSDTDECSKILLSTLLESPATIIFDNLTSDIQPLKLLCTMLTERVISGRILQVSKMATVSTSVLVLSSGNNVGPVRDMTRRCLTINLDPKIETPATRAFQTDPVASVRANRGYYVSLAITIIRAYLLAGKPPQGYKPLASYADWSEWVRGSLMWLGLPDPASSMFEAMAEDPDRETLGRFLIAWHNCFGNAPKAIREVMDKASPDGSQDEAALHEVIHDIAGERDTVNRKRLGRWVARHAQRIVGGMRFERDASQSGGSERWRVVVMVVSGVSNPPCGKSGEDYDASINPNDQNFILSSPGEQNKWPSPEICSPDIVDSLTPPFRYVTALHEAIASISDLDGLVGLDFETTGLDPRHDRPRLLSLADQSGKILVIDLFEVGGLPNLREVLASLQVVAHNAIFDLSFLRVAGINLTGDCTMIAAHVLTGQPLSLKDAVKQFLQIDIEKDHQQSDWSPPKLSDDQLRYAALDAQLALKLFVVLKERLIESRALASYEVVRDAQPTIVAMRLAGFAIDAKGHAQLVEDLSAKHSLLSAELTARQPDLNPNSPQQVDHWLRSVLPAKDLSSWPKTETGQLKTGRDELSRGSSRLASEARILLLDTLLPLKIVEKQLSTFGKPFKKHIDSDERIRANFKLCSTITGRMSCANPNLQQIPRESSFRKLFRAPEGRVLVIADFSQIELRVIAELAGEKRLQAIYREGGDVHNLTASLLLGKSLDELTKDDRQLAKAVNFGLIYGQGPKGLSHYAQASFNITMSEAQANDYRAKWFKTYPDIAAWHRHVEAEAQRSLEIRTPLGRKRTWTTKHEFKVTEAYNFPVQGGAAEIMLASLKYLMDGLSNMDAIPVAVIHDEIIVETIPELANNVKVIVEQSMLAGFRAVLPNAPVHGLVEAKVATSWAGK
jgi:DNA polymerase I-like protein with 3'-5' exonuclease and polymerase domains